MSTRLRGFASMDPEKQREIARKGGRAAHQKGTAHEWTSDEARVAARAAKLATAEDARRRARHRPSYFLVLTEVDVSNADPCFCKTANRSVPVRRFAVTTAPCHLRQGGL